MIVRRSWATDHIHKSGGPHITAVAMTTHLSEMSTGHVICNLGETNACKPDRPQKLCTWNAAAAKNEIVRGCCFAFLIWRLVVDDETQAGRHRCYVRVGVFSRVELYRFGGNKELVRSKE